MDPGKTSIKHFNLEPGRPPVEPPPPPEDPPANPEKIRIAHLLPDETLRMRDTVWGSVVAKTWNDAQFNVSGAQLDSQQRLWYQLGGSVWVASWYAEPVEALTRCPGELLAPAANQAARTWSGMDPTAPSMPPRLPGHTTINAAVQPGEATGPGGDRSG